MKYCFIALIAVVLLLCLTSRDSAAQNPWKYQISGNFGCNVFLNFSRTQRFPALRIFGALSFVGQRRNNLIIHYGPSLSIFTKTIGANLNPLVYDIQIDFANTFSGGIGWGGRMGYLKQFRTLHDGDYYNFVTDIKDLLLLSTTFVLNNHRRNQILGAITGSFRNFTINYNNDGVPFGWIGLADGFDRYWTGGGTFFIHGKEQFNKVEFGYDQFTGYQPLLYELSNIIGINVPLYSRGSTTTDQQPNRSSFNTSIYQLKIGFDRFMSLDAGWVGAMRSKSSGRYWGIQDWIHLGMHFSFHPNNDQTRFFLGASYNNLSSIKK